MKNYLKEKDAPIFVHERNRKLEQAYNYIKITINKIQVLIEDESLRYIVISDHKKNPNAITTIEQVTTSFCAVSIGADNMGRFNIVVSLDQNIMEKIGTFAGSTLLRRIFEFTSQCETFLLIQSLAMDCDELIDLLIKEYKLGAPWHEIKIIPKIQ